MQTLITFTCAYKGCTTFVPVTEILCKEHDQQVIDEIYNHQQLHILPDEEAMPEPF